ncbi:MFS transporter [Tranquillimonas rosea]|uniref:MFS transporter n=1 Tax=Tranquillimonas rosea TaxID=641238 RepID=UPI003BA9FEFE
MVHSAPAADAAPSRVSAWVRILGLFVIGLFAAAQFAKISVALPQLEALYPEATGRMAFAVAANGVAGIVLGVLGGALVASVGARRVLCLALVGAGALSLAEALVPSFAVFMVLRLLEGVTHLLIVVAAPTLMAASAPPRIRPVAMGLWGTFMGVGFAVTALVGVPVLEAGGVPVFFVAHGLGMLALAAVVAPLMPSLPRGGRMPGLTAAHRATYGRLPRITPALGFLWYTLNFVALVTFLPPLLGPGAAVILPLVALIGTFGAGELSRRIGPLTVGRAGFALTALLMPAIWLVPETAQLPVAAAAFVTMGLIPGATFAAVPALNPEPADQAGANGAIAQLGNVGSTIGTPLFSVALIAGPMGLSLVSALLCVAGIFVWSLLSRKVAAIS